MKLLSGSRKIIFYKNKNALSKAKEKSTSKLILLLHRSNGNIFLCNNFFKEFDDSNEKKKTLSVFFVTWGFWINLPWLKSATTQLAPFLTLALWDLLRDVQNSSLGFHLMATLVASQIYIVMIFFWITVDAMGTWF